MARTKKATASAQEPEVTENAETEAQESAKEPEVAVDPASEQDETPEPTPPEERPLPYKGTVNVALAIVRKAVGLGTADQLKPVGTIKRGTVVTVVNRFENYAQLANGLWIDESFLAV